MPGGRRRSRRRMRLQQQGRAVQREGVGVGRALTCACPASRAHTNPIFTLGLLSMPGARCAAIPTAAFPCAPSPYQPHPHPISRYSSSASGPSSRKAAGPSARSLRASRGWAKMSLSRGRREASMRSPGGTAAAASSALSEEERWADGGRWAGRGWALRGGACRQQARHAAALPDAAKAAVKHHGQDKLAQPSSARQHAPSPPHRCRISASLGASAAACS